MNLSVIEVIFHEIWPPCTAAWFSWLELSLLPRTIPRWAERRHQLTRALIWLWRSPTWGGGTKWSLLALEKLGLHVNHGDIIPLLLSPLSFVWVFSTHIFSSPQIDLGVTDFSWRKKPCQVVLIFHRKLQLWPLWTCWLGTTFAIRRSNTK